MTATTEQNRGNYIQEDCRDQQIPLNEIEHLVENEEENNQQHNDDRININDSRNILQNTPGSSIRDNRIDCPNDEQEHQMEFKNRRLQVQNIAYTNGRNILTTESEIPR